MTRIIRTLLIAITMIVSYVTVFAQQIFHEQLAEIEAKHFVQELAFSDAVTEKIEFSKETFSNETMTLPYRKATIPGYGDKASLVIYLHGGSSKGDDNETQMQEPGIKAIALWLSENNRKAIMLVPQCPADKAWLGSTQDILETLLKTYIDRGVADANKVYIFGGSMGGTGTWNMLSNHPDLFAAAMPVAGNPTGLNAEAVSQVSIYTVMGTADKIMKISNVEVFLTEMDECKAEYKFDIEDGWTHEDVCKKSYTNERLAWVFKHVKGQPTGIVPITKDDSKLVNTAWYSINGQRLTSEPTQKGIYIKCSLYSNGKVITDKYYKN